MSFDNVKKMKTELNSKKDFDSVLANSRLPVFAEFYADWCGPCKMIQPIFDELKSAFKNKVTFVKIDIEKVKDVAEDKNVLSLPTLIFFYQGMVIDRITGFKQKSELEKWLNKNLKKVSK